MKQVEQYETVIVGGGQAGLSVGYHLKQQEHSFVVLDASERIGDSWRNRWDSLRLYSPAFRDGLPGMPFPAPRTAYPTKDEMGDYLEAYAMRLELPVRSGAAVEALTKEDGRYVLSVGDRSFEADNVVVATGVFKRPYTPEFAGELDPGITQLHSSDYRNLSQLQDGPVLVVGASHSGSDIAYEASASHDVVLSGTDTGQIPVPIESRRGRMGFRALVFVGTHVLNVNTPMGRKMRTHVRHGGGPLLRYRKKDLLTARSRARLRAHGRRRARPSRARRRTRPRRSQRRLVHRFPTRLQLDSGSVRDGRRRLSGAVPGRRHILARPLLRGARVPALVRIHADRRQRQRCRTRCTPHRERARSPARSEPRRAHAGNRIVTEEILVWNGRVATATPAKRGAGEPDQLEGKVARAPLTVWLPKDHGAVALRRAVSEPRASATVGIISSRTNPLPRLSLTP